MTPVLPAVQIGGVLEQALAFVIAEQLPSGEIPNYRNLPNGSWEYCFSPLVSAYVYDALACFDALSPRLDIHALEQTPPAARPAFSRQVTMMRRRIRRFMAWQQSADGVWRFFGTGSATGADLDTTACAAAALAETTGARGERAFAHTGRALQNLCAESSAALRRSREHAEGETAEELVVIGKANAVRLFAMTGFPTNEIAAELRERAVSGVGGVNRTLFLYAMVRAHREGQLPGLESVRQRLLEEVLHTSDPAREANGPLTAALATHTLMALDHEDDRFDQRIDALAEWLAPGHGRRFEQLGEPNCGSAALTTAFIMSAMAKAGARI
jgi:hypothetical protein